MSSVSLPRGLTTINKRCFGTKPKLFRESGDVSGNRDTKKFFRETRCKKSGHQRLSSSIAQTAFVRVVTPPPPPPVLPFLASGISGTIVIKGARLLAVSKKLCYYLGGRVEKNVWFYQHN